MGGSGSCPNWAACSFDFLFTKTIRATAIVVRIATITLFPHSSGTETTLEAFCFMLSSRRLTALKGRAVGALFIL